MTVSKPGRGDSVDWTNAAVSCETHTTLSDTRLTRRLQGLVPPVRILPTPAGDDADIRAPRAQQARDDIGDETVRMHDMRSKASDSALEPEIRKGAAGAQEDWPIQIDMLDSSFRQARLVVGRCFQAADQAANRRWQSARKGNQVVLHATEPASAYQVKDADLVVSGQRSHGMAIWSRAQRMTLGSPGVGSVVGPLLPPHGASPVALPTAPKSKSSEV